MKMAFALCTIFLISVSSIAYASDPGQLQDFCVAVPDAISAVFVNGKFCKNPNMVVADDFLFKGLDKPGNTSNAVGSKVTPVNVNQLAGLNTLGVSAARIDFAPYGINPPHTHPRASEVFIVVEGTFYVGFVTSNPADPAQKNKLFTKFLHPGDVFVFPQGLIHFQFNVGKTDAVAFVSFGSQNPGTITIANAVFGSDPKINPDVLTKAFQVEKKIIDYLQAQFWTNIDFFDDFTSDNIIGGVSPLVRVHSHEIINSELSISIVTNFKKAEPAIRFEYLRNQILKHKGFNVHEFNNFQVRRARSVRRELVLTLSWLTTSRSSITSRLWNRVKHTHRFLICQNK